ncbi:MAG: hypothetical protein CMP24_01385 [Rickettsiales bacterium]|nr:hypothetical protein [Rickettsiales bacterium]
MLNNLTFAIQSIFAIYASLAFSIFVYSIKYHSSSAMVFFITFLANILMILLLNVFKRKINNTINQLIINFFLIWIILIIISSIPLIAIYESKSLSEILFVSTSLATTTGFSLSESVLADNKILILWQSMVQYIGAHYTLLSYLLFSLIIFRKETKSFFLNKKSIILFNILFLSLLFFYSFLLFFYNDNFIENFSLSAAILSTGGILNNYDNILADTFSNNYILIFLLLLMLIGLFFLPVFIFFQDRTLFKSISKNFFKRISFMATCITIIICLVSYFGKLSFIENLFISISFITTTGILPNSFENYLIVNSYNSYIMLFILFMVIGTFSGTCCGGLKIDKISIFAIKISEELNKFIFQHNVKGVEIIKRGSNQSELNSLYALISVGASLSLLSILILNISGYSVKDAFILSISSLTNTGEGIKTISQVSFENNKKTHFILNLLMICGRFENIGYILIITKLLKKN